MADERSDQLALVNVELEGRAGDRVVLRGR
jgi:hypothetical protein